MTTWTPPRHTTAGIALCRKLTEPQPLAAGLARLAWIRQAYPRGYVRVFADEGAPMAALLGQLAVALRALPAEASTVPAIYVAHVLEAVSRKPAVPIQAPSPETGARLTEPLSERELEVLRLLDAGQSNQRIARELTVALDTVKKHVSHILAKLDAASRTEAVARARKLGLIP